MCLHDAFADGKAQARSPDLSLHVSFIGPIELLEQMGQLLGRYPRSLVQDRDGSVIALLSRSDPDGRIRRATASRRWSRLRTRPLRLPAILLVSPA